jgi:hypothetical protein
MYYTFYYFDKRSNRFQKVFLEGDFTKCVTYFVNNYGAQLEPTELIQIKLPIHGYCRIPIIEYEYNELKNNMGLVMYVYNHYLQLNPKN